MATGKRARQLSLAWIGLMYLLFMGLAAQAQTTWTGATSTDWATASNWSTNSVPTATDNVLIPYVAGNAPTIGASTVALANSVGVAIGGTLTITSSATLTINGAAYYSPGIVLAAFHNLGTVHNRGKLVIGNLVSATVRAFGLVNEVNATFNNNTGGEIHIDRSASTGLFNGGSFTNVAKIVIGATASVGSLGLVNRSYFTNQAGGDIRIDNSSGTGLENFMGSNFTNEASLIIGAKASVGQFGLINNSNFTNQSGGDIHIDNSSIRGLWNNGLFTNAANLVIGGTAPVGTYGIHNYATFHNDAGGQIHIDRSTSRGLDNTTNGNFTNAALIVIGAKAGVGEIGLINFNATFTNNAGGEIHIDRSSLYGLSTTESSTFTNAARIVIGAKAPVGTLGIRNVGTFNNQTCASLSVFAPFGHAFTASFIQQGLLTVNTTQPNHFNYGFTNNGIIVYPQGNPIPNVTNNKIIVVPIPTSCGQTSTPALQIGPRNDLTVGTTWYQDQVLSTPAGTYSPNTFTVTNLAAGGTYPVYFALTDPATGCSQTVSIPITLHPEASLSAGNGGVLTCSQTSLTLTATGGNHYSFAGPGITSQDADAGTAVVNAPGTYTVTATGANGCSTTASAIVREDKAAPTPSITASATTLSAGQSVTLTAGGGTSYAWSTGETRPTITLVPPTGTTVYSLTAINDNGCSVTTSITIHVTDSAPVVVRGPARLCVKSSPPAKATVTLALTMTVVGGNAPYTYRWSYTAPNSVNYKSIAPAGTSIGKVSFVPVAGAPSLSLTGTKGNLNGLQGYLIRLTVLQGNVVIGSAQTLLDGSCPLTIPTAREGVFTDEEVRVRVYPNPVSEMLQVELRGLSQPAKVVLYDVQGRIRGVWQVESIQGTGQLKADVSAINGGMYLLQVETVEGVMHRQKVLKPR
jgi:hypothetical protein